MRVASKQQALAYFLLLMLLSTLKHICMASFHLSKIFVKHLSWFRFPFVTYKGTQPVCLFNFYDDKVVCGSALSTEFFYHIRTLNY